MRVILVTSFLFSCIFCFAQEEIFLENSSFEDYPKLSHTPTGWHNCGNANASAVDVHPVPDSKFKVDKTAYDGETYLGMVVRENETWEAVGQRLSQPLEAEKAYSFSIHLARSTTYLSSLSTAKVKKNKTEKPKQINFATPIKLRIWGGDAYCKKVELLAESSIVINTRWLNFNFQFEPHNDYDYITFEAFYKTPVPYPYNGNILLDNASSITEIVGGFISKKASYRTDTISKITKVDTVSSKVKKAPSPDPKTELSAVINKVPNKKTNTEKEDIPAKKEAPRPKMEGINDFSSSIIDFYKKHTLLIKFQDKTSELDELSQQALSLIAERLLTVDKGLKIIIQAKAANSSLKKERMNTIKSVLSKAKLKEDQYTFGFETNTPVLLNESNSSIRIKLCLR